MPPKAKAEQVGVRRRARRRISVLTLDPRSTRGMVKIAGLSFPCALGRSGCRVRKREGDGATPIGRWTVREVLFRPDRVRHPHTGLPARLIRREDGWCDAPSDRNYNRPVRHPYPASAERLWRLDGLYDVVVVLGYNDRPRLRGRGSAIFMHVASAGYAPTEGCIALARPHLLRLLQWLARGAVVHVGAQKNARRLNSGR